MEEVWAIEEVDFNNIKGLSMDCFLPPADLKKEEDACGVTPSYARVLFNARSSSTKMSALKVVALDIDDLYDIEGIEELQIKLRSVLQHLFVNTRMIAEHHLTRRAELYRSKNSESKAMKCCVPRF
ncbi:hypothetical protein NL676_004966 [Syzygium grande]|nr:hypothetical protein NL676_004966 [Syzygium grande]